MVTKLSVTGASGFVGRGVMEHLAKGQLVMRGISRQPAPDWLPANAEWATVDAYDDVSAMRNALEGTDCVLHLADDPVRTGAREPEALRRITDTLARVANDIGIRRVVAASSIYARADFVAQSNAYGAAKREMEDTLLSAPGLQAIILRLPPVYGPRGRGGMATLAALARRGVPLPFGAATSERSYLSLRNLATLVERITASEDSVWQKASGRIFEPSDGRPISTRDLAALMGQSMNIRQRLIYVPRPLLYALGTVLRRQEIIKGALDPLRTDDISELETAFGWRPVEQMPESLAFLASEVRPA